VRCCSYSIWSYGCPIRRIQRRKSAFGGIVPAAQHTALNFREMSGGTKPESTQRYSVRSGLEEQSRKAHSGTAFGVVWRGEAGKHTAVQHSEWSGGAKPESIKWYSFWGGLEGRSPSRCAAGATPPHIPSKFPAHSAPEKAVAVLCANKIDFVVRMHLMC
jgi:hypothetical protein